MLAAEAISMMTTKAVVMSADQELDTEMRGLEQAPPNGQATTKGGDTLLSFLREPLSDCLGGTDLL